MNPGRGVYSWYVVGMLCGSLIAGSAHAAGIRHEDAAAIAGATRELNEIAPGLYSGMCPLPGVATGGQPAAEDFARFAAAGYKAVVDLRDSSEARGFDPVRVAQDAGLEYIRIVVTPGHLGAGQFDAFREVMRDEDRRPILVQCATGNRVGAIMIPYLVLDRGLSRRKALELAKEMGLHSAGYQQAALDYLDAGKRKRRASR